MSKSVIIFCVKIVGRWWHDIVNTVGNSRKHKGGQNINTLKSRLVASWVGKSHSELLTDIGQYSKLLKVVGVDVTTYWEEDGYYTKRDKTQTKYLISQKGCELICSQLSDVQRAKFNAECSKAFNKG